MAKEHKKAETKDETSKELKKEPNNPSTEPNPEELAMKKEIVELTDTLQRLQAEFENYKKRCEKENKQYIEYAEQDLVKDLLPVLDSFELSLKNSQDHEKFRKGVELIFAQLFSTLKEKGLLKIESIGKEFDPYLHEVLITEESDNENIVIEELQPGYKFKDKVIRHSKVKIGKKKNQDQK